MIRTRVDRVTRSRTDRRIREWKGHHIQLLTAKVFVNKLPETPWSPDGWRIQEVYDQLVMRGDYIAARIWEKTHPRFAFKPAPAYFV